MNNKEFSNNFDVKLSSYAIPAEFGEGYSKLSMAFNEYEKSLFLTEAENEIFINLYNGKNIYGDFFEGTEELRRYLDNLIRTEDSSVNESKLRKVNNPSATLSDNSIVYKLPDDLAFITLEQVTYSGSDKCIDGYKANVYPVTQDEYARVKDNPFRGPTKYKVLRVDRGQRQVELISNEKYNIGSYLVKYLKKPNPIVLIDLTNTDLSIEGFNKVTECEMDSILHDVILDRAVALAVQSKALTSTTTKKNKKDE